MVRKDIARFAYQPSMQQRRKASDGHALTRGSGLPLERGGLNRRRRRGKRLADGLARR